MIQKMMILETQVPLSIEMANGMKSHRQMVDHHVQNLKQILNPNLNPDFMSCLLQKLT